jgi:hypothetical protein
MTKVPSRAEVARQLDILRDGVRITITTIRKLERGRQVDAQRVLRRLQFIRAEASQTLLGTNRSSL